MFHEAGEANVFCTGLKYQLFEHKASRLISYIATSTSAVSGLPSTSVMRTLHLSFSAGS